MTEPGRWGDLTRRVVSGVVIAILGFGALWAGEGWLLGFASVAAGLMIWELSRMTAPGRPAEARVMGVVATVTMVAVLIRHNPYDLIYLLVPSLLGVVRPRADRAVFFAAAFVIMLACYGVVAFRAGLGFGWVMWLVLLVVAVDVLGYFGGRLIGGPKFWPAISPKKTWSGTISGWVGAALVGAAFWLWAGAPGWIVPLSALVGLASQMGDIAESAVKRRAGIKDASNVIPGHGGVMDRFDGLSGASVFLLGWGFLFPWPQIGG